MRSILNKKIIASVFIIGAVIIGFQVWSKSRNPSASANKGAASDANVAISDVNQTGAVATTVPNPQPTTSELLPDLALLPPRDLKLSKTDGKTLLLFSTTYYNQGTGHLELRADPATAGRREDLDRRILQRVYLPDGKFNDLYVGTFMWHQEHLHYHYTDFITYDLDVVDAPGAPDLSGNRIKSTYCLRDISKVDLPLENRSAEAKYKICGKELQGVAVGWGDTYYFDYPAQNMDISELPTGTYKMTFYVNPAQKLKELNYNNNIASAVFKIDRENNTVTVLEEFPKNNPSVEHIHLEDPFGITPH